MNPDPASLDNLRDIALPVPVPWWPPAPGWWVLCAVLVVVIVVVALRTWRTWRANAYRREALRELQSARCVAEIAEILKRTALCAYPRTDIAALSGPDWCQWLGETGAGQVPDKVAKSLTEGVFGRVDSIDIEPVSTFAADWIRHHRNQTEGSKDA